MKNFTDNQIKQEKKEKLKSLIINLYDGIRSFGITEYYPKAIAHYSIKLTLSENINSKNYTDFYSMFNFLNKVDIDFFDLNGVDLVIITKNLDKLIDELEVKKNVKNYNL